MEWKVGDQFIFLDTNERGGPEFGIAGDVGEVIQPDVVTWTTRKPALIFRFVSVVEGPDYDFRKDVLEHRLEYYASTSQIRPLTKDYKIDQEPLDDEETL